MSLGLKVTRLQESWNSCIEQNEAEQLEFVRETREFSNQLVTEREGLQHRFVGVAEFFGFQTAICKVLRALDRRERSKGLALVLVAPSLLVLGLAALIVITWQRRLAITSCAAGQ